MSKPFGKKKSIGNLIKIIAISNYEKNKSKGFKKNIYIKLPNNFIHKSQIKL